MKNRLTPDNTAKKQRGGFRPGQSGNPAGRPRGSLNRTTLAAQTLLEGEAEALTRTCIERAKAGDATAMRIAMERICPPVRERTIRVDLPNVTTVADLPAAHGRIIEAVSAGEISPSEASAVCGMLGTLRQSLEIAELEQRMAEIERRLSEEPRS